MVEPSQTLLYGAVLLAIALGFLVLASFVAYTRLLSRYSKLKDEKGKSLAETRKQTEEVIEQARQEARVILKESRDKASQIVRETGTISEEARKKMLVEISHVSQDYAKNYQGLLDEAKVEALNIIKDISNDIRGEAKKEVQAMKEALTQEIVKAQNTTRNSINESLAKVEAEIQTYKQAKLTKVDQEIIDIIRETTQKVIGRTINPQEHEDLVIKSLEEAKKENVL